MVNTFLINYIIKCPLNGNKREKWTYQEKRVFGFFINLITLGGLVAGYKYESDGMKILVLWFTKGVTGFLFVMAATILYWFDIATMGKNDGTHAEKWASNRKVSR